MHKRLLSHDSTCNIDEALQVFPFALLTLAMELMTTTPHSQTMLILDDVLIPKPFARFIQGAYRDHDHALDI